VRREKKAEEVSAKMPRPLSEQKRVELAALEVATAYWTICIVAGMHQAGLAMRQEQDKTEGKLLHDGAPLEISRLGFAVGSYMPEDVVCSDCIRDGSGGQGGAKAGLAGESCSGE
jgi:hypothetical protein